MKTIIITMILAILTVPAWADPPTKIGFRAISSASSVTCGVFGMGAKLRREIQDSRVAATPIQAFAPDPSKSRIYTLGTKGFANRSTAGMIAIKWTCVVTGTDTAAPVKVFMNEDEAYFLTVDQDTWGIGQ